jgi:hypothetical protein
MSAFSDDTDGDGVTKLPGVGFSIESRAGGGEGIVLSLGVGVGVGGTNGGGGVPPTAGGPEVGGTGLSPTGGFAGGPGSGVTALDGGLGGVSETSFTPVIGLGFSTSATGGTAGSPVVPERSSAIPTPPASGGIGRPVSAFVGGTDGGISKRSGFLALSSFFTSFTGGFSSPAVADEESQRLPSVSRPTTSRLPRPRTILWRVA